MFKIFPSLIIKGALSGLKQSLSTKSPLKMMENAFHFTLTTLFVLKMFKFLSWLFRHVEKWLDSKDKVNFKIYDITTWLTNNWNTQIDQYFKKNRQSGNAILLANIFLEKSYTKCRGETISRPFSKK